MCPVTVPDPYNEGLDERKAIYKLYPQAIPNTYAVTKKGHSPCKRACAVHTSAQGYLALIADGRYAEAYTVASDPNPFTAVCGRVCTHKCETDCTRGEVDEPLAIAGLKRFVSDYAFENVPLPEKAEVTFKEKVAVVGAGPSGLTAARDLALLGYAVTVLREQARARRHAALRHPRVPPAQGRPAAGHRPRAPRSASTCSATRPPARTSPSTAS